MKILNFSQFINEAKQTKHSKIRFKQRIEDSFAIELPQGALAGIRARGLNIPETIAKITELIKSKFSERYSNLITNFNEPKDDVVVLLLRPVLKLENERFPVRMMVTSIDTRHSDVEKTYSGEKLCVYIRYNNIATIKVLPNEFKEPDIIQNFEDSLKKDNKFIKTPKIVNAGYLLIEINEAGEVFSPEKEEPAAQKQLKDFTLSPGRKIQYFNKLTNSQVEVEIVEVINKETYKRDKEFKLKIRKSDGSEALKTIKAGDMIWLDANGANELVRAKVADQLYTIDNRVAHPILKVIA